MTFFKVEKDGYLLGVGKGKSGTEITEDVYNKLTSVIRNKPKAESGYDYKLKTDLTWELYELPQIEEQQGYTAEQLAEMTNAELSAICSEMGISGSMTKANMIALILDKQSQT